MTIRYTAVQIRAMVGHVESCEVCGDDPEISAGLYDEGLDVEKLADFIATGHDPAWLALLTGTAR
ncbi:hypothetical protein ABZU75_07175 [Streptosporangium sp. NPDC005286]|uniref:hypothetical protein n=1 Tax=Streptosporangium sp. NPDC005286 TaxID=3154463 RepID=UPI0033A37D71